MRIAIDIRPALSRGTGVGMFIEQLALGLDRLDGDHKIFLFTSSWKERWLHTRLGRLQRTKVVDKRWPVGLLNFLWHRLGWPKAEYFLGSVDITHSPTPLLMPGNGKHVITLHDLYYLKYPEATQNEVRRDYVELTRRHARKADGILAVSNATAEDSREFLGIEPEKITICWEDAAPLYDQPPTSKELEDIKSLIPRPFILFVGTIEPRKNLAALVKAFGHLSERHKGLMLVIAGGSGWGRRQFDEELGHLHDHDSVWISGYRDQRFIRALYHRAAALVMPSHCEGFGLPLVEAMACGCPLIVADNSAMPEVAGDAALYWRSGETEELSGLMEQILTDSQLRESLVLKGRERRKLFSWNESAGKVLAMYENLVG